MLIATALVAVAVAAVPTRVPVVTPLAIGVVAAVDVPASLLRIVLEETDAIWNPAGIAFAWTFTSADDAAALCVVVDNEVRAHVDGRTPLGWISFDARNVPDRVFHVSYANAKALLEASYDAIGSVQNMPIAQRELYLGRAMGRALAHELGHYLLASKSHARTGLMRASRTSVQFVLPDRQAFAVPAPVADAVVAALRLRESAAAAPATDAARGSGSGATIPHAQETSRIHRLRALAGGGGAVRAVEAGGAEDHHAERTFRP